MKSPELSGVLDYFEQKSLELCDVLNILSTLMIDPMLVKEDRLRVLIL